jgi:hypothetical protein
MGSIAERLAKQPLGRNLPVRFDEREQETEPGQTGLRGRGESPVKYPPGGYSHCACSRLYSPWHSFIRWPGIIYDPARPTAATTPI